MKSIKSIKSNIALILILITFSGCISHQIKYDKWKIVRKYSKKNYRITLEGKEVNFRNLYLDKENLKSVYRNRKEKRIEIKQKNKANLVKLDFFESDTINLENIGHVVINGLPMIEEDFEKIILELNAVKDIKIITEETIDSKIFCRRPGDVMLIILK